MATHRDLARALFLREIGSLRRITVRQPVANDPQIPTLFALLGAQVTLERAIEHIYFAEDGGLPTLIPHEWSLEAVL